MACGDIATRLWSALASPDISSTARRARNLLPRLQPMFAPPDPDGSMRAKSAAASSVLTLMRHILRLFQPLLARAVPVQCRTMPACACQRSGRPAERAPGWLGSPLLLSLAAKSESRPSRKSRLVGPRSAVFAASRTPTHKAADLPAFPIHQPTSHPNYASRHQSAPPTSASSLAKCDLHVATAKWVRRRRRTQHSK